MLFIVCYTAFSCVSMNEHKARNGGIIRILFVQQHNANSMKRAFSERLADAMHLFNLVDLFAHVLPFYVIIF